MRFFLLFSFFILQKIWDYYLRLSYNCFPYIPLHALFVNFLIIQCNLLRAVDSVGKVTRNKIKEIRQ
jgi:hypothetical protein